VESLFANVRLRGGCNDLTDCRTAEYALRQILRSGLIKTINNSNAMNGVEYTSNVKLDVNSDYNDSHEIAIILNDEIAEDLENLTRFNRCDVSSRDIRGDQ
jgi:predicted MarR family transcription regulator